MYNFYQSHLRETINTEVYWRETIQLHINDKAYRAIIKRKKIWLRTFRRFQIQWVQREKMLWDPNRLKQSIKTISDTLCTSWSDFFVQFGSVDIISSFDVKQIKFEDFCDSMKSLREQATQEFMNASGTSKSIKENMPNSTISVDLWATDEQLIEWMGQGCRQQIKRAMSKQVLFDQAKPDDRDSFYAIWKDVSTDKWFHIPTKEQYDALKNYLIKSGKGNLFVAYHEWSIVSGSIILYDGSCVVYLYGWSDRHAGNLGSHQFLMFEIMKRVRDHGYEQFDLMWGAPTGYPGHALASVSKFKEALGGEKIEYLGNFDYVKNKRLYKLFLRKTKH